MEISCRESIGKTFRTSRDVALQIVNNQMTQDAGAERESDFTTIEDQSWAKNVKCGDTLKRFKQNQPRSIASSDFFSAPANIAANVYRQRRKKLLCH